MSKKTIKTIKDLIRANSLSLENMESIVRDYAVLGLKKSEIRNLLSLYESYLMKNVGVLDREVSHEMKEKIKNDFNLQNLFVRTNSNQNIDQTLKIGDSVYTFKVKDKLRSLK